MWYSISSVRNRYWVHSCSCEFTCCTPTDPNTLPRPARPCSFAPQGTDCMLSTMPLGARFFLSLLSAIVETARTSDNIKMSDVLMLMEPPLGYLCLGYLCPATKTLAAQLERILRPVARPLILRHRSATDAVSPSVGWFSQPCRCLAVPSLSS